MIISVRIDYHTEIWSESSHKGSRGSLPWQLVGDRRIVGSNPDPPGNPWPWVVTKIQKKFQSKISIFVTLLCSMLQKKVHSFTFIKFKVKWLITFSDRNYCKVHIIIIKKSWGSFCVCICSVIPHLCSEWMPYAFHFCHAFTFENDWIVIHESQLQIKF